MAEHATNYTAFRKPVPRYGPWGLIKGQSPTGYGKKIPTDYMIQFKDDARKTRYRVYCICYSNVGSLYVLKNKEMLFIGNHELQDAVEMTDKANLEQGR